jgi:hypothetical protein
VAPEFHRGGNRGALWAANAKAQRREGIASVEFSSHRRHRRHRKREDAETLLHRIDPDPVPECEGNIRKQEHRGPVRRFSANPSEMVAQRALFSVIPSEGVRRPSRGIPRGCVSRPPSRRDDGRRSELRTRRGSLHSLRSVGMTEKRSARSIPRERCDDVAVPLRLRVFALNSMTVRWLCTFVPWCLGVCDGATVRWSERRNPWHL